jgi:RNA polymerase sigma-70 factor (ECF subfamily)
LTGAGVDRCPAACPAARGANRATCLRRRKAASSTTCSSRPSRLRVHALSLTRNRAEADDLVQDAVALALRGRDTFEPGTNFAAWSHSIVRNRFISGMRQRRRQRELEDAMGLAPDAAGPPHDDRLALKELSRMLGRLPAALREALLLVAVQGMSHDDVAAVQGCAVGTAKSRVFRARHLLRVRLLGGPADAPVKTADARASALSRAASS